ncbi:hypothetical protein H4219_006017, partial [Mycoemilia scoparia]
MSNEKTIPTVQPIVSSDDLTRIQTIAVIFKDNLFSGTKYKGDTNAWFRSTEGKLRGTGIADDGFVRYIPYLVTDTVFQQWQDYAECQKEDKGWSVFKEFILLTFGSTTNAFEALHQLDNFKFASSGLEIGEYNIQFKNLCHRAGFEFNKINTINKYLLQIPPDVAVKIRTGSAKTLDEVQNQAKAYIITSRELQRVSKVDDSAMDVEAVEVNAQYTKERPYRQQGPNIQYDEFSEFCSFYEFQDRKKRGICVACGSKQHRYKKCRIYRTIKSTPRPQAVRSLTYNTTENLAGNQLTLPAKVNDSKVTMLVDNGSQTCCVRPDIARRTNSTLYKLEKNIRIQAADGREFYSCTHYTKLNIYLDQLQIPIEVTCLVAPVCEDIILGMSWLKPNKAIINCGKNSIRFETKKGTTHTVTGRPLIGAKSKLQHRLISVNQINMEVDNDDTESWGIVIVKVSPEDSTVKISAVSQIEGISDPWAK